MAFAPTYTLPSKRIWASFVVSTEVTGLSEVLDLAGATMAGIAMSAAWTGAANLTFLASPDGVSYSNVYGSSGDEITYTVDANRIVTFDPAPWLGIQYLKVRSGTAAAPVEQASPRTLYLGLQALGVIR